MSDLGASQKKPAVPSWQVQSKPDTLREATDLTSTTPDRTTVIEQAKKFLEEDEVKDATTNKKVSFLESKGLSPEEIQSLLGVSRNREATAQSPQSPSSPSSEISRPTTTSPPPATAQTQPAPQHPARDIPPIITYPEFLTTSPTPQPLVTRRRLLTTLYLFSGLTALLYGTSNYLVTPMLSTLTESRLSLAETAKQNLQKLITKLEAAVSEIPPTVISHKGAYQDAEESDEDPAEMFHRDIGTQTTLPSEPPTPKVQYTVSNDLFDQTSRLVDLKFTITSLIENSQSEGLETDSLSSTITNLRDYLDGLAFAVPGLGMGHGGYSTSGYTITGGAGRMQDVDDEIAKVKAGIMGVKGALLSTRTFPRGVGVGSAGKSR